MRAQILKIAGVRSEKAFYKKFPTGAAFMKKHGKAFKKAQNGMPVPQGNAAPATGTMYKGSAQSAPGADYYKKYAGMVGQAMSGYKAPEKNKVLSAVSSLLAAPEMENPMDMMGGQGDQGGGGGGGMEGEIGRAHV